MGHWVVCLTRLSTEGDVTASALFPVLIWGNDCQSALPFQRKCNLFVLGKGTVSLSAVFCYIF